MTKDKTNTQVKYRIKPEYIGLTAWTIPPFYPREQGGRFELNDTLSQEDLGYLFEVVKYEGIEIE